MALMIGGIMLLRDEDIRFGCINLLLKASTSQRNPKEMAEDLVSKRRQRKPGKGSP